MEEAIGSQPRKKLRIPAGQIPSPRWFTSKPDPLSFRDEVRLTKDERITLIFLSRGFTLREIQGRLKCSYREAQRHRTSVHRKLDSKTDAHAVFIGIQRKELNP